MSKAAILVAEDDPETREWLRWHLEAAGFEVIPAADGAVVLHLLARHQPAALVTDLLLPGVDGIELIRRVRGAMKWGRLPIVVLSAYSNVYLMEAHRSGATVVLRKPGDLPRLVETINRLLPDRRESRREQ
jgi:CheY-like chemotaxis protein